MCQLKNSLNGKKSFFRQTDFRTVYNYNILGFGGLFSEKRPGADLCKSLKAWLPREVNLTAPACGVAESGHGRRPTVLERPKVQPTTSAWC